MRMVWCIATSLVWASVLPGLALAADVLAAKPPGEGVRLVSSHRTLPRSDGAAPAVQVADNAGNLWDIRIADGGLTFVASSQALAEPVARPKDILPDGEITHGQKDIASAWLIHPTERYGHGVLGDAIEAAGLVLKRRSN
jgi:hypothetical protein